MIAKSKKKQISLNRNTTKSLKRKTVLQTKKKMKDLNEPCDLGSKRSQMEIKQKELNCSKNPKTSFNNHQIDAKEYPKS